jgi:Na+-translocating ferredoxin:NAD+ oxidoreductase subunit D
MQQVLFALVPAIAVYVWVFGAGILITLVLATLTALLTEALLLRLRGRPVAPFINDYSAIITAWLLALAIPPLAPWWLIVVGTFFSILVAKQLYGGLGYNLFNPAMIGYAVLLISFPTFMTKWPAALDIAQTKLSFSEQLNLIFNNALPPSISLDAISSATPLDYIKTQLKLGHPITEIKQAPLFGDLAGKGSELIAIAYLAGGVYLWWKKIITWHLPVAFIVTLTALSGVFWFVNPQQFSSPLFHLLGGASMLGAFFIITDPVSGPTTPKGKLYFAAGVAFITFFIRIYGGYPDGIAFAVIFMNICVPLIDAQTQPRVFGHEK